ncbi:hypothetical protein CK203_039315 [Vitis vinifera]|uniref:Uncharacterized protein n=1 Tax=Vitis vinifera TaxID=29760 RepID=A0A438HGM6_VITVI|nr:hypothetical protein CK203_039315 [Vitis vinifera]
MSGASVGSQLDGDRSNFSRTFKYLMGCCAVVFTDNNICIQYMGPEATH